MVDLGVTGSAQGHKVFSGMGAALRDRDFVMYLCRGNDFSFICTPLTQRMLTDMAVTDTLPSSSILLIDFWGTLEFIVLSPCNSRMDFTVLPICQFGATRI